MHPYYSKNKSKYLKQINKLMSYAKDETREVFASDYSNILKEVQTAFTEAVLEDLPFVGGSKNSNDTSNLVGIGQYTALFLVGRKHGIEDHKIGELLTIMEQRHFKPLPGWIQSIVRCLTNRKFAQSFLVRMAVKSRKFGDEYPYAWVYVYREPDNDYSLKLDCVRCGAWKYLKEKDFLDIMPYVCNIDHVCFASYGLAYYRNKAIGYGDELCNNRLKRDGRILTEHWPPHGLKGDGFK